MNEWKRIKDEEKYEWKYTTQKSDIKSLNLISKLNIHNLKKGLDESSLAFILFRNHTKIWIFDFLLQSFEATSAFV